MRDAPVFGPTSTVPTRLLEIEPGLLIKFECESPGGSHKTRAARYIIRDAIARGLVVPGRTTVIEKSGGNFGLGLVLVCAEFGIPVELAVGLSFSPLKRRCLSWLGATLIGLDQLRQGMKPREVIDWHLTRAASLGRSYFYPDQFNNPGCVLAHEQDTGAEIAAQLTQWSGVRQIRLVACAGTGAHLTGITRALMRAGWAVDVTLVEPSGCDSRQGIHAEHPFEGMSVGVIPPLLDWSLVQRTTQVRFEDMRQAQLDFALRHGFLVGPTSAACLAIATRMREPAHSDTKVMTLVYDHGTWYPTEGVITSTAAASLPRGP